MKWLFAFKRLSGLTGALSFIPGIGPIAAAVSAVVGAVSALFRTVFDGLTKIAANPLTLAAMCVVGGGLFVYGIFVGIDLDGRQANLAVKQCNLRIAQFETQHNTDVLREVEKAHKAADNLEPTPTDLTEACKRSASCRSKEKL